MGNMTAGYVYILINQSMPGLLKIGKTVRDSRARARELSTTGVPTPFQVAFELFSDDFDALERTVHRELNDFRVATNREFFRYPIDKAIRLLQQLNSPPMDNSSKYAAEDILQRLQNKYSGDLNPDIVAVRIIQAEDRVWLEITTEKEIGGYLRNQTIERSDLGFISDGSYEDSFFDPQDTVSHNADKFIDEYDPYSIIMTTELFHEEAYQKINLEHLANKDR